MHKVNLTEFTKCLRPHITSTTTEEDLNPDDEEECEK